jgi:hypothetical protein
MALNWFKIKRLRVVYMPAAISVACMVFTEYGRVQHFHNISTDISNYCGTITRYIAAEYSFPVFREASGYKNVNSNIKSALPINHAMIVIN